MPPRALLFDFDGVIADTENIHIAAWERTFGDMGWTLAADACLRAAEVDDRTFLAEVFAGQGIDGGDVEGWVGRKQALTATLLAGSPRVYPGVVELIGRLHGRARLGIVSTTWRENIAVVLRAAGLAETFEVVIGKEDVKAAKPDPEGYRKALRRLKLKPAEALAIENSVSGQIAALHAGLRYLIVGHRAPPTGWAAGAPYLADFSDTAAALHALGFWDLPERRLRGR